MLRKIFDMDNGFMRGLSRITDMVILNILFLVCCIPIVTIGASLSALYSMTLKMVRNEEPYIIQGFLKAFRENLKQGMLFGTAATLALAAAAANLFLLGNVESGGLLSVKIVSIAVIVLVLLLSLYIFPVIARFQMSSGEIFKNAFLLCGVHFTKTLFMLAMYIPVLIMMFYSEITMFLLLTIYIVLGFSTMAFLQSFVLRNIFANYEPKEPEIVETAEEKR